MRSLRSTATVLLLSLMTSFAPELFAMQDETINEDESRVPAYVLPDPLRFDDGSPVRDATDWPRRRAELLETFRREMFGRTPEIDLPMTVELLEESSAPFDGRVRRRQFAVRLGVAPRQLTINLLLYVPAEATGPVPTFLGLNFNGNHTVEADPAIVLTEAWVRDGGEANAVGHRATDAGRGTASRRWPIAEITAAGYGVATAYYGEIDPDEDDGWKNGIHGLVESPMAERPADAWGSIAAWAWGMSRLLDALRTLEDIDGERVIAIGHSRLGKTALWAGAEDERFAMVVSNDSGCGGAAISRRKFGETVKRINSVFPHWFCDNYVAYGGREETAAFDQHELIALIAPRPVHIGSASKDLWADPRGEFLAGVGADPVYRLLGTDGLASDRWPSEGESILSTISYHLRGGEHDLLLEDWQAYIAQADRYLRPR
ncbi:MAG TPA: acetylxylan esterase [Planctomycetaceae bacterium]|nr:acetylxylan esterase [Planctomycetaceae bacterium]HRF01730.1 acetylxylan esterase [Pirellulaceae bacterium]